jgi:hypothetical protein
LTARSDLERDPQIQEPTSDESTSEDDYEDSDDYGTDSGSEDSYENDSSEDEEEWEVEEIVDAELWYQVKWAGCDEVTWEPAENLRNAFELVEEYHLTSARGNSSQAAS